jgi:hypothetical protein
VQQTATRPTAVGRWSLPDVVGLGGAVAGLLAGIVMVVISPILSFLNGITIWEPPRLIASTLLGESVLNETGFALQPVLIGLMIHLIVSTLLGVLFGIVLNRVLKLTTDFGLPIYFGIAYGLIGFFVAYFIALPILNPVVISSYIPALVAQNVIYGICLGIFYSLVRPKPYTNTAEQV